MAVPRLPGLQAREFQRGTLMVFQQTTAPLGWTKQTTHNDKALRVVTGTASSGGATAFTSVFNAAGGSTTLTTSHLPASGLSVPALTVQGATGAAGAVEGFEFLTTGNADADQVTGTGTTGNMGTGGGHTHVTPDLQFVDVIIASKQ